MLSLAKTLLRWYSTVRGLMKSWLAISGFDSGVVRPAAVLRVEL
jgi:hypothetical protein